MPVREVLVTASSALRLGAAVLAMSVLSVPAARAGTWQAGGALVDVSIELDGATAPLYPARDGSGRHYLEARAGCAYVVHIRNHGRERVGVVLAVDGLNAISGEREPGPSASHRPGRMYVIDPWDDVRVRGWRTSLEDVRLFTFVDERASYAARSGRANGKMGWIEAWVYRERPGPRVSRDGRRPWDRPSEADEERERARRDGATPPPEAKAAPSPSTPPADAAGAAPAPKAGSSAGAIEASPRSRESFPGTGWGGQAFDPVTVVTFVAEPWPADVLTLRYEYAPALRALGLLPPPWDGDRLRERERGDGFARPPAW